MVPLPLAPSPTTNRWAPGVDFWTSTLMSASQVAVPGRGVCVHARLSTAYCMVPAGGGGGAAAAGGGGARPLADGVLQGARGRRRRSRRARGRGRRGLRRGRRRGRRGEGRAGDRGGHRRHRQPVAGSSTRFFPNLWIMRHRLLPYEGWIGRINASRPC